MKAMKRALSAKRDSYPTKVLTHTLTTSKVAYFKRKYAEEEDLHQDYHGYFPKHLILPEDRTCILKLSLEKLRFLEDPETYLRRETLFRPALLTPSCMIYYGRCKDYMVPEYRHHIFIFPEVLNLLSFNKCCAE
ncbi:SERTA domain-containing protein 4-like [Lagenorhynchus albirostris]|uniref:SERTA domain-containing protein 4-like n=1 Tax=Lagenorhynchus albirostris TaxID=27610 RepID=UPI0028F108A8|nr:SERTA domain-containing protein 4-like [Lagenorhynchus albirostris]